MGEIGEGMGAMTTESNLPRLRRGKTDREQIGANILTHRLLLRENVPPPKKASFWFGYLIIPVNCTMLFSMPLNYLAEVHNMAHSISGG